MAAEPTKYTAKLKGARVLVIGGSSGIGFGVAEALIEHGAGDVIISSSSPKKVAAAISRIEASYPSAKGRLRGVAASLGSIDTLEAEIARVVKEATNGGAFQLDHVVHSAGDALAMMQVENITVQGIQQAGMVRFYSPLILAKHLKTALKPGPHSSYTITSGGVMDRPQKGWSVVGAYAAGLGGITRGLALDLAPIRVNCIAPGAVETELWDTFKENGTYEGMKGEFVKGMTTGVIGQVEDVADQYLTMMKDKNITGSVVCSNGGCYLL